MFKLLVVVVTCGVIVFGKLPSYITKCSIKDPNINSCALNSARAALPDLMKGDRNLNMPVMDPVFVPELRVVTRNTEGSVINSTVVGLKGIILENIGFDFEKKEISLQATVPSLNLSGNYRVSGKVASLPISGNGAYRMSLNNLTVRYKHTFDLQKLDDGEVYMIFRDYDCDLMPQHLVCRVENLFNGDKLLGDAMNTFINQNWRSIYKEVGKDVSMAVGQMLFSICRESAKSLPFKEIFNDVE